MSVQEIIHHGWLIKSPPDTKEGLFRGLFKKKWKRRYFLLTLVTPLKTTRTKEINLCSSTPSLNSVTVSNKSNNKNKIQIGQHRLEMSYYDSEKMAKKVGSIDLQRCEEILSHLNSNLFEHVFAIKTYFRGSRPRTYFLVTETEEEMVRWVGHLCRCLKMVNDRSLSRYSNRSSAGSHVHHHVQPLQRQMSIIPSSVCRSAIALDCRSITRTPTLIKKPLSIDYSDDGSLSTLSRNVTLSRLNSVSASRNNLYSPYAFNLPLTPAPAQTSFHSVPQCPPPSNFHEMLPLLVNSHNTLPNYRLQYQVEEKLTNHDHVKDANFMYFTENVNQLLYLQKQYKNLSTKQHDESSGDGKSYYDTPRNKYSNDDEDRHFYHNHITEFYDIPADKTRHVDGADACIYSKEVRGSTPSNKQVENDGSEPEFDASLPDGNDDRLVDRVYSVPRKIKKSKSPVD